MGQRKHNPTAIAAQNGGLLPKPKKSYCRWCQNQNGKTDIDFSVVDDDFGAFVHPAMIKYCPFCGRNIKGGE